MERYEVATERQLLKAVLLLHLHQLLESQYANSLSFSDMNSTWEYYLMDTKMIQHILRDIIATGCYTLEGIALYTRIPFDIVLDAACGRTQEFFVTSFVKLLKLYMEVKPETSQQLIAKLIELNEKNSNKIERLLYE